MKKLDVIKIKRIDNETLTAELMTINDDLSDFYREIECDTIDIVKRRYNGRLFDVILDDNGLLKDDPGMPSSWWQDMTGKYTPGREGLYGTLLLCHGDDETGELISADYQDLLDVQRCFCQVKLRDGSLLTLLFHDMP